MSCSCTYIVIAWQKVKSTKIKQEGGERTERLLNFLACSEKSKVDEGGDSDAWDGVISE